MEFLCSQKVFTADIKLTISLINIQMTYLKSNPRFLNSLAQLQEMNRNKNIQIVKMIRIFNSKCTYQLIDILIQKGSSLIRV